MSIELQNGNVGIICDVGSCRTDTDRMFASHNYDEFIVLEILPNLLCDHLDHILGKLLPVYRLSREYTLFIDLRIGLDIIKLHVGGCFNDSRRALISAFKPCACMVKRDRDYYHPCVLKGGVFFGQVSEMCCLSHIRRLFTNYQFNRIDIPNRIETRQALP